MATVEVLPGRLFYLALPARRGAAAGAPLALPPDSASEVFLSIEEYCAYFPFFLDFGPSALNRLFRFCVAAARALDDRAFAARRIYLVTSGHAHRRANSVYLISAFLVLQHGRTPEEALRPFAALSPPVAPWHDASPGVDAFHLTTLDVLRGVARARACGFFSLADFNVDEYETYEQVANGDMNWIVPGRFLAFAGPHDPDVGSTDVEEGYHVTTVSELLPVFRAFGITGVVRLNKKYYDERRFVYAGMKHADLYFLDGSNPPEAVLQRFLRLAEETPGALAVRACDGRPPGARARAPFVTPPSPPPPPPARVRLQGGPRPHGLVHWRVPHEALRLLGARGDWLDARVPPGERHWAAAAIPRVDPGAHVGRGRRLPPPRRAAPRARRGLTFSADAGRGRLRSVRRQVAAARNCALVGDSRPLSPPPVPPTHSCRRAPAAAPPSRLTLQLGGSGHAIPTSPIVAAPSGAGAAASTRDGLLRLVSGARGADAAVSGASRLALVGPRVGAAEPPREPPEGRGTQGDLLRLAKTRGVAR